MADENVIFLGSGGPSPALMMASGPTQNYTPVKIASFPRGYSVYALAVSPEGSRLAVGTRAGLIHVYSLANYHGAANSAPLFDIFHYPGVTDLAFCTSEIFASGGRDGKIKVWSLPEKKQLAEINAHQGGVYSLCRIGSLLLASLGADKALRVWDMDSLEEKFASEGIDPPKVPALTCLDYNPASGFLIHPSRSGELYVYDAKKGFAQKKLPAHNGDFCALACGDKKVATAGSDDATLKVWSEQLDRVEMQTSLSSGALAVGWVGGETLLTIAADGAQVWSISHSLVPGPRIADTHLRVCQGLPNEVIAKCNSNADRQWRDGKIEQAQELMSSADPQSQRQLGRVMEELKDRGFSAEAALVLADASRAQDRLLWELESRLAMVRSLKQEEVAVPSLYALADLLAKVREPALAIEYFEQVHRLEPDYRDLDHRIAELGSDPLLGISPEDTVRGDLRQPQQVLQEIEKCTILDRYFSWSVIIDTRKVVSVDTHLEKQTICRTIALELDKLMPGRHRTDFRKTDLFYSAEVRKVDWVYVSARETELPVAYGLEVRGITVGCELVPHAVFDPSLIDVPQSVSHAEHNKLMAATWTKVATSSEVRRWLSDVNSAALRVIQKLRGQAFVKEDQGLF